MGGVIHPADFTFVCPTELEDLENRYADFKAAGCEIYSVSCDTHFGHKAWHDHSERIGKITYPMLADPTHALAKDFDVLIEADGKAERPAARASVHKVVDSGTDSGEGSGGSRQTGLLSDEIRQQLSGVFAKMEKPLILELHSDNRPVSEELKSYIDELAGQTDKLSVIVSDEKSEDTPFVRILQEAHSPTGLAFHGVPGGHEFTSFVLGFYNASEPYSKGNNSFRLR